MNGNILIVDDDTGSLKLLKEILAAENYTVRPFNNGELALRSTLAEMPELILLDIRMPGMDGFEVCRRLKENELLKDIPVIFISAAADVEDKVKAFQVGGVDYILKPFQKEEIIARVRTHVSLSRSRQEIKFAAAALSRSERSLKIAQSIAHLGHWEWDVTTGKLHWSEEACRILGLLPDEPPPNLDAFLETVHPEDRDLVANHIRHLASQEEGFDIEFRIITPDGDEHVVHGVGEWIFRDNGLSPEIIGTLQKVSAFNRTQEVLGIVQDITKMKQLERKLEKEARTDALTGAIARGFFMELAEQELARSRRYDGEFSVLMLDLDDFKSINDQYGHHAGDMALKKLIEVCDITLREVDIIGRMGGDEFVILLPETGGEKALEAAERLRHAITITEVLLEQAPPLHFTTSIGVATLINDDPDFGAVLLRADKALYEAKNAGHNRVCGNLSIK